MAISVEAACRWAEGIDIDLQGSWFTLKRTDATGGARMEALLHSPEAVEEAFLERSGKVSVIPAKLRG